MSGLGGKPKASPVSSPEAVPDETSTEESKDRARKRVYKGGRAKTFLTGNLEPVSTGKKTLLG
jgi:hypothetical protein